MPLLIAILLLGAIAPTGPIEKQVLANDLPGGYQVLPCDVNGDGNLDLIALASNMPDLVWFENPSWKRHTLATNFSNMINAACWQESPHQPPIIAVASGFSMHPEQSEGIVSILTPQADPLKPWSSRVIDKLPASHRLRWADIDGSGHKVLINVPLASANGRVPLVYYRTKDWKRRLIGDEERGMVHGIFVTDWDGNGRDSILIGSFLGIHLYRFLPDGQWSRTEIAKGSAAPWPKCGTSDVAVSSFGKKRIIAAIEPWHGNEVAVYRKGSGGWQREVIDNTLLDGHTIEFDAKGRIIAGFRGKPYGVYLYSWNGATWLRQILEQGEVSAASCAMIGTDLACIGSATHNLVLYKNVTR